MHNLFLNQQRGAKVTSKSTPIDDLISELPAPPGDTDAALDLTRCLQRLPEDQRAVLLLVTLEDMSYADAAKVLGVPIGTVMSRLSRARSRLRELMDGGDPVSRPVAGQPQLRRMK
jgi:RNA polymerase sigma-70 factor (ECF subfamily)